MVALLVALVMAAALVVAVEVVPVIRARRGRVLFPLPASSPEGIHGALAPRARESSADDELEIALGLEERREPAQVPSGPRREPEEEPDADVVLQALIDRVRNSKRDMVAVVSEMVEQDLDATQMQAVLTRLVGPAGEPRRTEELTLSGHEVPARPGRLTAFGDMSESEKRRVIIRVLCLLIAQADDAEPEAERDGARDDDEVIDLVAHEALSAEPDSLPAPDVWVDLVGAAGERRLPMRRPLVRSRL